MRRLPHRGRGLGPAGIGAASILAGVLYTGGPRPYGYEGLGELFVFLFFGIVAVTGSYYVQAEQLTWEAFVLAVPVGLLASAILVVNNVRDLETDRRAGKRTLAVRLGRERARNLYGLWSTPPSSSRRLPWVGGVAVGVAAAALARAALAVPLVRLVRRACRRAHAQPGAGAHRHAAAGVLRAAVGGPAAELMEVRVDRALTFAPHADRVRRPEQARAAALRLRDADGRGWGEAAPLEPYDGVSPAGARGFEAYEAILRDGDGNPAADRLERCAWSPTSLRRWPGSTSRSGTWRAARGAARAELIAESRTARCGQRHDPGRGPGRAAEQAAAAAPSGLRCLKVKVGIGDDAGRVAAVRAAAGAEM